MSRLKQQKVIGGAKAFLGDHCTFWGQKEVEIFTVLCVFGQLIHFHCCSCRACCFQSMRGNPLSYPNWSLLTAMANPWSSPLSLASARSPYWLPVQLESGCDGATERRQKGNSTMLLLNVRNLEWTKLIFNLQSSALIPILMAQKLLVLLSLGLFPSPYSCQCCPIHCLSIGCLSFWLQRKKMLILIGLRLLPVPVEHRMAFGLHSIAAA